MLDSSATIVQETWQPSTKEGILFPVGLFKLAIMSVTTLGVYQGYWMYRNWKYLRQRRKIKANSSRRSDYPFFFIYPLFREIRALGTTISSQSMVAPAILFTLWLALTFLTNLPDPYYLLGNLDIIPILIVQSYVNKLNRENGCERFIDHQLTAKNWLAIAAGIVGNVVVLIISLKLG
jgi:hypothetical protein